MRILLILFIYIPLFSISQKALVVDNVTHILVSSTETKFLKKLKRNFYKSIDYYIDFDGNQFKKLVRRDDSCFVDKDDKWETIIEINKIEKISLKKVFANNHQLLIYHDDKLIRLAMIDENYLALIETDTSKLQEATLKNNRYLFSSIKILPIFSINLGNKKNIIQCDWDDKTCSIANMDGEIMVHYDSNKFVKATKIKEPLYLNLKEYYKLGLFDLYIPIKKSKGYTIFNQLKDSISFKNFDTVVNFYGSFIAKTKNKIELYNYQFKKISIPKIRAFGSYGYGIQVLIKNNLYFLDLFGNIDSTKTPQMRLVCGMIGKNYDYTIKDSSQHFFITRKDDYNKIRKFNLVTPPFTQSVTFLSTNKFQNVEEYNNYSTFPYTHLLLKNKGKYGISLFKQADDSTFICNEILKPIYDTIFTNTYYLPAKFYKDNLWGCFPQNKKVRYKLVDDFDIYHHPYKCFTRFELPNGKKGWLDRSGNEYIDH